MFFIKWRDMDTLEEGWIMRTDVWVGGRKSWPNERAVYLAAQQWKIEEPNKQFFVVQEGD